MGTDFGSGGEWHLSDAVVSLTSLLTALGPQLYVGCCFGHSLWPWNSQHPLASIQNLLVGFLIIWPFLVLTSLVVGMWFRKIIPLGFRHFSLFCTPTEKYTSNPGFLEPNLQKMFPGLWGFHSLQMMLFLRHCFPACMMQLLTPEIKNTGWPWSLARKQLHHGGCSAWLGPVLGKACAMHEFVPGKDYVLYE